MLSRTHEHSLFHFNDPDEGKLLHAPAISLDKFVPGQACYSRNYNRSYLLLSGGRTMIRLPKFAMVQDSDFSVYVGRDALNMMGSLDLTALNIDLELSGLTTYPGGDIRLNPGDFFQYGGDIYMGLDWGQPDFNAVNLTNFARQRINPAEVTQYFKSVTATYSIPQIGPETAG